MKKISEVCDIVGVTRRTLQEYDRIGLVKPSARTESGYWLYDDAAIQKLILIRIYLEAGYKRTEIKQLLESSAVDVLGQFDSIVERLEEKRRRIDGMISTVRTLQQIANMPDSAFRIMADLDMKQVYREKSFSKSLEEMIDAVSECEEEEREEIKSWSYFWYNLSAIGHSRGTSADSEIVQSVVSELYRYMKEIMSDETEETVLPEGVKVQLPEEDNIEIFCENMFEMMEEPELRGLVEKQCGAGGVKQILSAVKVFREKRLQKKQ